jgi:hypothetical protein
MGRGADTDRLARHRVERRAFALTASCTAEKSASSGPTATAGTTAPEDRERCLSRQKGAYSRVFDAVQALTQAALSRSPKYPQILCAADPCIHTRAGTAVYIPAIPGYCELPVRRSDR